MLAVATSSTKDLEDLLTRAAGRPIAVTVRPPRGPAPDGSEPEPKPAPTADIRQHPLVKATEELFGARVVRVDTRPQ